MDKDKTIKNWKWWIVLPLVLPVVAVISVPKVVILVLEFMIAAVELVNVGEKGSKLSKRLVSWVQKDT